MLQLCMQTPQLYRTVCFLAPSRPLSRCTHVTRASCLAVRFPFVCFFATQAAWPSACETILATKATRINLIWGCRQIHGILLKKKQTICLIRWEVKTLWVCYSEGVCWQPSFTMRVQIKHPKRFVVSQLLSWRPTGAVHSWLKYVCEEVGLLNMCMCVNSCGDVFSHDRKVTSEGEAPSKF